MRTALRNATWLALLLLAAASAARGQQTLEPAPAASTEAAARFRPSLYAFTAAPRDMTFADPPAQGAQPGQPMHRFWDRTNLLLFAGVGGARFLDYASTLNIRRRGLNEALLTNSIVDNHPLFAGIEASATAASIGVSYLFHVTNHHRLERWTSIVHIGVAVGGAVRNYSLKTAH